MVGCPIGMVRITVLVQRVWISSAVTGIVVMTLGARNVKSNIARTVHNTTTRCGKCNHNVCNNCGEMKACEGDDCEDSIVLCEDCYEKKTCSYCDRTRCSSCVSSYPCESDDCPNVTCHDCELVEWRSMGRCSQCNW